MLKTKPEIEAWLKSMHITNFTINDDLTVDVSADVRLQHKKLTSLPVQFGRVGGSFVIESNELRDLNGCPKYVGGLFDAFSNQLVSLKGSPEKVGGTYNITANNLTSLKDCAQVIGKNFKCFDNPINTLNWLPKFVAGDFLAGNNSLINIDLAGLLKVDIKGMVVAHRRDRKLYPGLEVFYKESLIDKILPNELRMTKEDMQTILWAQNLEHQLKPETIKTKTKKI